MIIKKLSLLIFIISLSCNIATAETKDQVLQRIKEVEQERANNDKLQANILINQGIQLRAAKASLEKVNTKLIPSLQNTEAKFEQVQSKYDKLKTAVILIASILIFLLVDKFLNIIPPPYKWYIAGTCSIFVSTILYFKI